MKYCLVALYMLIVPIDDHNVNGPKTHLTMVHKIQEYKSKSECVKDLDIYSYSVSKHGLIGISEPVAAELVCLPLYLPQGVE